MQPWRTTELVPGLTADELARRLGRSVDAVRSAARRHGIPLAPKPRGHRPRVRQMALRLRQAGHPYPEIAHALGVSARSVQAWVYASKEHTMIHPNDKVYALERAVIAAEKAGEPSFVVQDLQQMLADARQESRGRAPAEVPQA